MPPARFFSVKEDRHEYGNPWMKDRLIYFLGYIFPIVVYCIVIFYKSSLQAPRLNILFPHADKIAHILAYTILGGLVMRAFQAGETVKDDRLKAVLSVLVASLYGASDEFHQYFVAVRSADILDLGADIIGCIIGVLAYRHIVS